MTETAAPSRSHDLEQLQGLIERVTFHSAESGFAAPMVLGEGYLA
jgi:hypothetical protein